MDLTALLDAGPNTLGAQVLFFGQGDGTWPTGKCGFIFRLEIEFADGGKQTIVSDENLAAPFLPAPGSPAITSAGTCVVCRRSLTRAFIPMAGRGPSSLPTPDWLPAMPLDCPADKPPLCATYPEYMLDTAR